MPGRPPRVGLLALSMLALMAMVGGGLSLLGLAWWAWAPGGFVGGIVLYYALYALTSNRDGCVPPRDPGDPRA